MLDAEAIVREVVAKQLKIKPDLIDLNARFGEWPLEADDLDVVEILMEVEERLGVEIPDAELEKISGSVEVDRLSETISPRMLVQAARRAQQRLAALNGPAR